MKRNFQAHQISQRRFPNSQLVRTDRKHGAVLHRCAGPPHSKTLGPEPLRASMRCSRKGKTMKPLTFVLLVGLLLYVAGSSSGQQQGAIYKGVTSVVKLEQVVSGHLTELNGKYKLRVSEVTIEPGGGGGPHHHAGPGIRYVLSGEQTIVRGDTTTIFKKGDYFYDSGDITHSGGNKGNSPLVVIGFEILPADWVGGSGMPPKSK